MKRKTFVRFAVEMKMIIVKCFSLLTILVVNEFLAGYEKLKFKLYQVIHGTEEKFIAFKSKVQHSKWLRCVSEFKRRP